jgi:hypothetical protein
MAGCPQNDFLERALNAVAPKMEKTRFLAT